MKHNESLPAIARQANGMAEWTVATQTAAPQVLTGFFHNWCQSCFFLHTEDSKKNYHSS